GLVGMRVLEAPEGSTVLLNAWSTGLDWNAGRTGEEFGYGMLSGSSVVSPQHAHERIGHMPPNAGDMRMSVTAGPLTLAPGDSAQIVIAVAVAPPVGGTYTSGVTMQPGDPLEARRPLAEAAANLRQRMVAAEGISW